MIYCQRNEFYMSCIFFLLPKRWIYWNCDTVKIIFDTKTIKNFGQNFLHLLDVGYLHVHEIEFMKYKPRETNDFIRSDLKNINIKY